MTAGDDIRIRSTRARRTAATSTSPGLDRIARALRAFGSVPLLVAGLSLSADAAADAQAAVSALYARLERLHDELPRRDTIDVDDRTLVRGVYRLQERSTGQLIALFTESGDILGDSQGWKWIEAGGTRPLSPGEADELKAEMMRGIQWERLLKVAYGGGGARHVLLISAVNCPVCARMEDILARRAASLDTTFYVLPISLTPSIETPDGKATWRRAAELSCAADGALAWRRFWAQRETPQPSRCAPDEGAAFATARNFSTVLASIGVRVRGTPTMVREDGETISFPPDPDDAFFDDVLGPKGLSGFASPLGATMPPRWLGAHR